MPTDNLKQTGLDLMAELAQYSHKIGAATVTARLLQYEWDVPTDRLEVLQQDLTHP